jgi:hypothetical protein
MKNGVVLRIWIACLLWEGSEQFILSTSSRRQQRIIALRPLQRSFGSSSAEGQHDGDDEASSLDATPIETENQRSPESRRAFIAASVTAAAASTTTAADPANAVLAPRSIRPTVYRVDGTIPPVLQAIPSARRQTQLLNDLGAGSGTLKAVPQDINLNNILNRVVFGTVNAVRDLLSPVSTAASASFVCLALASTEAADMELCTFLAESILARRAAAAALGLVMVPITSQEVLDQFTSGQCSWDDLASRLTTTDGVPDETVQAYRPLLTMAQRLSLQLLAMGLPIEDSQTVLKGGLQSLDPDKRSRYVVDPTGFIAQTNDPKFKLYTERVLLKNVDPDVNTGNYFAERILAHEAAATVACRYVMSKPKPRLVTIVAPTEDLRYLGGINGRLPRVYNSFLSSSASSSTTSNNSEVDDQITNDAVTTILLNPTAASTLSLIKRLRLEIGTGPDTIQYQTKVADYLWFSSSPAVSLLHRVMDY